MGIASIIKRAASSLPKPINDGLAGLAGFGRVGSRFLDYRRLSTGVNTTGVFVDEHSALSLPAVYCAVNCIASDLSAVPLELVQKTSDGRIRPAVEHPAYPVFARSPDGQTTSMRWRGAITAHAILYGGGFAEIVPSNDRSRVYLFLLDPARVQTAFNASGDVAYQTPNGLLPMDKVVSFAGLSHDGLVGHPVVRLAREAIGLGIASQRFGAGFIGNGTAAAGWFQTPNTLTKEARDDFLTAFEERHAGSDNAGRVGILPPGWSFVESKGGATPEQAQLLGVRDFSVLDVARLFRVPPHKLGNKAGESYASIEASNLEYVQSTLVPWAEALEQSLNLRLLSDAEVAAGYGFRHDFRSLLRADSAGRAALYKTLFVCAAITPNEIRASEGMPPVAGGDDVLVPLNMTKEPANGGKN